jgi:hypothetical protein
MGPLKACCDCTKAPAGASHLHSHIHAIWHAGNRGKVGVGLSRKQQASAQQCLCRQTPLPHTRPTLYSFNHGPRGRNAFACEDRVGLLRASVLCLPGHLHVGNLCEHPYKNLKPTPAPTEPRPETGMPWYAKTGWVFCRQAPFVYRGICTLETFANIGDPPLREFAY